MDGADEDAAVDAWPTGPVGAGLETRVEVAQKPTRRDGADEDTAVETWQRSRDSGPGCAEVDEKCAGRGRSSRDLANRAGDSGRSRAEVDEDGAGWPRQPTPDRSRQPNSVKPAAYLGQSKGAAGRRVEVAEAS